MGAELEVIGDGEPGVGGRVLRDEADLGQLRRAARRLAAEDLDRARCRCQHADSQVQQGRLSGPVRTDQPDDVPGGDAQRAVGQSLELPVPLAESPRFQDGGHTASSLVMARAGIPYRASMLSSSSPARRALASQRPGGRWLRHQISLRSAGLCPKLDAGLAGGLRPQERTCSAAGMNRDRRADDAHGPGWRYVRCMRLTRRAAGPDPDAVLDVGLAILGIGLTAVAAWRLRSLNGAGIAGPPWLLAVLPLLIGAPLA